MWLSLGVPLQYKRHKVSKSIFRSVDRIKLIVSIIKASETNGVCVCV